MTETTHDRPDVTMQDGIPHYRMSSLGTCIRGLVAARLGIPPSPPSDTQQQTMDEGHLHEPDVLRRLGEDGWQINDTQRPVTLDIMQAGELAARLTGHVDAVGVDPGANGDPHRVLEVKSASKDSWAKWMAKRFDHMPRYRWQAAAYSAASLMSVVIACKNRNDGRIDVWEPDELPSLDEITQRVLEVERCAAEMTYPPCDVDSSGKWFCSYRAVHDDDEKPARPTIVGGIEGDEFWSLIRRVDELRVAKQTIEDELRPIEKQIKDKGAGEWSDGRVKVSVYVQHRRPLDVDAVRKALVRWGEDPADYERDQKVTALKIQPVKGT